MRRRNERSSESGSGLGEANRKSRNNTSEKMQGGPWEVRDGKKGRSDPLCGGLERREEGMLNTKEVEIKEVLPRREEQLGKN